VNDVPLNSTEGFVRQIIGWREFIRGIYESRGSEERTTNFWNFKKKIPASFYDGTTGILPIDQTIKKVLKTGYCNHIERLMVLGNFMMLCEFDPDEVYRWFMELFVDSYDWVMVTNIYGMSQFSDGGLMATKPYISGSNYVMKMSNYKKGIGKRLGMVSFGALWIHIGISFYPIQGWGCSCVCLIKCLKRSANSILRMARFI
jgi:deoxyribodipyrimidine photolyase-related protein